MTRRVSVLLASLLLFLLPRSVSSGPDCVAAVVARLGKATPADADAVLGFASRIPDGAPAAEGLFAALEVRRTDGARRVLQILEYFPGSSGEAVFTQISRVGHVGEAGGLGKLVVNLGKSRDDARSAASVLRFATNRIDPARVAHFEFDVPGGVVDLVDDAGNFFEFKTLDLDGYPEFLARKEFESIRDQGLIFHGAVGSETLTLVFENPIPSRWTALFDEILQPLTDQPNVNVIDGF
jgi:hypothetical protein